MRLDILSMRLGNKSIKCP